MTACPFFMIAKNHLRIFATNGTNLSKALSETWKRNLASTDPTREFDMVYLHMSKSFAHPDDYIRFYRAIIEDVQIMTIVREPLSHALSWLTYTQAVNDMNTLVRLIPTNSLPENPMALGSSPSSLLESASTSVFAVKRTS
eukprot:m.143682 g.143682  ORF g.143682 m.143682 type:complete len:141 (+) comp52647_c0_seq39:474-896(+)